ncbi:MAG: DUF1489 domain-containing protein [Rhodospirillaceae bacterium]|nr:DUF1489 domain-containing protein [Rhodospirillaceae bacterium]
MTLHLIKLAVGAEDIESVARWQKQYRLANGNARMRTRMMPKRIDELLNGGSLYWVIKRAIQVRQNIIAVHEDRDENGKPRCMVELDPKLVETEPYPFRPFQGWRYLKPDAAPPDVRSGSVYIDPKMPAPLRIELRRLGLL